MAVNLINNTNLGVSMALWLANDGYDHDPEGAPDDDLPILSATRILVPTKVLILGNRVPAQNNPVSLVDRAKARVGQSVHTAIEEAFASPNRTELLIGLGFAPGVARNMAVNPTPEFLAENPKAIPVYLEQRNYRKLRLPDGTELWISGKFDQVTAGRVEDNKITSTYKYTTLDSNSFGEYSRQLSIYRWLNPSVVTADVGQINFIFPDWKRGDVSRIQGYPPSPVMESPIKLMSLEETERMLISKVQEIIKFKRSPEEDIPPCTPAELWMSPNKYQYFSKEETANSGGRASKNFDTYGEAVACATEKGKGVVRVKEGTAKRCGYCDAALACTQRLMYQ